MPCPPRTPKPPQVYPPISVVIDDIHDDIIDLGDTLLQHGTVVQGNVGQGIGTYEAGPSHAQDPHTTSLDHTRGIDCMGDAEGSERRIIPHPCTTCGGICYGPSSQFQDDGLHRYVSKNNYFHIIFCFIS